MNVIRSVIYQWDKAEFAHQLELYLMSNEEVMSLFVGLTTCKKVCLLISTIATLPTKPQGEGFNMSLPLLLDILLQCFLLVYVKEIKHQNLNQSEQLLLSVSEKIASQILSGCCSLDDGLIKKSKVILSAIENLKKERKKLRHQNSNMGRI